MFELCSLMRTTLKTIALLFGLAAALDAQQDRIAGAVDRTRVITLKGNRHPGVGPQNDQGLVTPEFALSGMTLLFKQSPAQESALQQLIAEQQNPASVNYRRWLTPDQYADRFGVSHNDIAKVTAWLKSEGFTVGTVARGRNWIVFSGTARQVQQTFRTEIHRYLVGGELHYANAAEPSIPSVLGDVVSGIDGLDDFYLKPASVGQPLRPTFNSGSGAHFLAPDDLATIYDIAPLYSAGIDGTGQKVVVVGETALSDTALMDVAAFRTRFNLPANVPNTVLDPDYPDPGIVSGDVDTEAHLDLELIGSVARNATIIYVYSGSVFHAIEYAIDHDLAPVISVSFIGCESESVHSLAFLQSVARQANSMGITWINGSGDAGPASCDRSGAPVAQDGLDVGLPQDIPEVTAVGGTKFDEADGTFWGNSNSPNGSSAVSYIPERVWNDVPVYNGIVAG